MIGQKIDKAAAILRQGGLVAIPTETVYGLAANALDSSAVLKIFEAKNRPSFDPLIVHVGEAKDAHIYAQNIPQVALRLMDSFWPGPLTFILEKKALIPHEVTSGHSTVGLRMPNHPIALSLLKSLDFPLAAPSANPFGYVSPTSAAHVSQQLNDKVDYILDGGRSAVGVESTIIAFEGEEVVVLRLGGIEVEAIEKVLGKKVLKVKTSSSNPKAPGMLDSHYNPGKKVILVDDIRAELQKYKGRVDVGALTFSLQDWADNTWVPLTRKGDIKEAAKNLFHSLRLLDHDTIQLIIAERVPETGLGPAINDRLKRASV